MDEPSFDPLPLTPALREAVARLGFERPTPIQALAIPPLIEGRDLVGQAETGSGKTLAFCLPLLQRLSAERRLQALVLCPTRELCGQLTRALRTLGRAIPDLRVLQLTGGRPFADQARFLATGAHAVVGTPGRTLDHLKRGTLDCSSVTMVVLDEADRMLDMGFLPDITAILDATPPSRQTALFSATVPDTIRALSRTLQRDPVEVGADAAPTPAIRQEVWPLPRGADRVRALDRLLLLRRPKAALVFCDRRDTVEEVATALRRWGHAAGALHGGLAQEDRDAVMAQLRNGSLLVVVATDLAARGLDVDALDLVVHLDLPSDAAVFLHRTGRTGRAGRDGLAATLLVDGDPRAAELPLEGVPRRDPADLEIEGRPAEPVWRTLRIGGGRRDKLRRGDILGALTGDAGGLDGRAIGRIEVGERVTFVAVATEYAAVAIKRLARGRIKGRRFRVDRPAGTR